MRRRNFKIRVTEDNWISFQRHAFNLGYKWFVEGREIKSYKDFNEYIVFLGWGISPIKESSFDSSKLRVVEEAEFFKFERIPTKVKRNKRKLCVNQ